MHITNNEPLNTENGNNKHPTSGNSIWMGGFDYYELHEALTKLFVTDLITNEVNKQVAEQFNALKLDLETQFHELKHDLIKTTNEILICNGLDIENCCNDEVNNDE